MSTGVVIVILLVILILVPILLYPLTGNLLWLEIITMLFDAWI